MKDPRDDRSFTDEDGVQHYKDADGKVHRGVPPMQSRVISKPGGCIEYDTSQGHCGLCGRLGCHGKCFK